MAGVREVGVLACAATCEDHPARAVNAPVTLGCADGGPGGGTADEAVAVAAVGGGPVGVRGPGGGLHGWHGTDEAGKGPATGR